MSIIIQSSSVGGNAAEWETIPDQAVDESYPNTITGLKASYYNGPQSSVVALEDQPGDNLVSSGVVTYDDSTDTLTVNSDPGGMSVRFTLAEADWQTRISGIGVVWYHDFRSSDEVDAFRWLGGVGNDPDSSDATRSDMCRHNTSDGITGGGCLEIVRKAGTTDGAEWWRPFSPMDTGSGKTVNDPGANGTIAVQAWSPTQGGAQTNSWRDGYYGHPSIDGDNGVTQDGNEYWLQFRVKIDPNRPTYQTSDGGKLIYLTRTDLSLTSQEVVVEALETGADGLNYFSMYRSGSPPLEADAPGISTHGNQPGVEGGVIGDGVCRFDDNGGRLGNCWVWPTDEWVTVMFHIIPGTNSGGELPSAPTVPTGNNDTTIEVKVAESGASSWATIWNQSNADLPFQTYPGQNALIISSYLNGINVTSDLSTKFDQLIFSTQEIALPAV